MASDIKENSKGESHPTGIRRIMHIDAGVRYAENAEVNGIEEPTEESEEPRKMPFLSKSDNKGDGWHWRIDIDINTGRILNWPKGTKASTHYKVCDCCRINYPTMPEYYDYVPDFLALDDEGWEDYIMLTIDGDGQIENWDTGLCEEFIEKQMKQKGGQQ